MFILKAESTATLHAWVTALSEVIAETRQAAAGGGSGGGGGGGAAVVSRKGGNAASQQQSRRFTGALERAGLCGPMGGPAIPAVPGAVWENPAFIDLLADSMLTKEAAEHRRGALATGASDGALRPLVKSSTEVGRALG